MLVCSRWACDALARSDLDQASVMMVKRTEYGVVCPVARGNCGWPQMSPQAKETKCGEKDGKESQRPIVVLKRGNGPPGPRGAKGVPRCGRGVGTTPRTSRLTSVSPRNHPVV